MNMVKEVKIIIKRFKSSIKRGTGEAYLLIQNHPKIDFSPQIIKASLTNYAYDGQSEGSRAVYLFELITISRRRKKIRKAILQGLAKERKDTWSLVQLFDLASFYAKQGDKKAKKVIYKRFFIDSINDSDWCGYEAIINLDGLKGLKFIATTIGKYLEKNHEDWQDASILTHFQDIYPGINAENELKNASADNKYIKIYLDNINRTEESWNNHERPIFNFDTLLERIENSKYLYNPQKFTKSLTEKEVLLLADKLLVENDKLKIEKYLSIFSWIKFPYEYQILLTFAKIKDKTNNRIAELAIDALRYFSSSEIRRFALEKLNKNKSPEKYTKLLIYNYKSGDCLLLTKIANNNRKENIIHELVDIYIEIYTVNKTRECKDPLESIYKYLTCGIHRKDLIRILIENNVLSEQIKSEIKYDSYYNTRELINKF